MSRIGGGGPPKPGLTPPGPKEANLKTQEGVQKFKQAAGKHVSQKVVDSFQKAEGVVASTLQQLSGPALANKLNFTNTDLALLAQAFALVLRKHPNADRKARSKLFAKAILKKKIGGKQGRLARLLDEDNEDLDERDRRALEELYEALAEQLESSPVFAQLVDEVTESARKLSS
jgi:hypothetical protein